MEMSNIPFGTTDWSSIERTEHAGETGAAFWQTQHFGELRVRMVEYTPGYLADHWCEKGHILLCLHGELHTELEALQGSSDGELAGDMADLQEPYLKSLQLFILHFLELCSI